ncbi:ABC transporter ATP-binding protein [Allorhizobium borbori]|uniref:ABC-type branched-subunit amino acid transport system ATPase component n=1 Tax=Allorhizobium borbori TaxID=485907 RepID=A0A7W6K4D4_9HYPH|nr:ABC transporter ATP-binding protein [Allorhizobium borbori]MBB4104984.1 ABC-type branched-subunit amino acid transport system ATPase component [Allorhizobium borbori]
MTSAPLLELSEVGKNFGGFAALKAVSFTVPTGGITGLMGPNGSGKTTLFNIISGFIAPSNGTVAYRGKAIGHQSVQERSLDGLVRTFQTPKVFERLTVVENVMTGAYKKTRSGLMAGLLNTPASRREIDATREAALATCRKFDLGAVAGKQASLLPAGQRRLLELARAYQGDPQLLLLDEPSSGLTTTEIEAMTDKLRLIASEGITILIVSHDMDLMGIAENIHVLDFGRIICSGSMAEVQENTAVREAYLGV